MYYSSSHSCAHTVTQHLTQHPENTYHTDIFNAPSTDAAPTSIAAATFVYTSHLYP